MTRDEIHEALDVAVAPLIGEHGDTDPAKTNQLTGHLATVHMAVDQILDDAAKNPDGSALAAVPPGGK